MCYKAFTEKARTKRIAGEDIKVYKICTYIDHGVISYYKKYTYVPLKVTHKISITFTEDHGLNYIADGYHSYKSCKWFPHLSKNKYLFVIIEDTYNAYHYKSPVVIAEFIIPKNTAYCQNSNGEIISERIMFTGIIHKPIIYEDDSVDSIKINLNEENRTVPTEACE